jgi:hypothetical protein
VKLLLRRDVTLALVRRASGKAEEAPVILERALARASQTGLTGVGFEIRLAMAQAGEDAGALAAEARSAGFLLIARKAR